MKYKVYSEKEWKNILQKNGYELQVKRGKGGHSIYKNVEGDTIIFPKSLNPMLLRRTIKEHNLKED